MLNKKKYIYLLFISFSILLQGCLKNNKNDIQIAIQSDDEATVYIQLKDTENILDTYKIYPYASDRSINGMMTAKTKRHKYLLVEFFYGSAGTYAINETTNLFIFDITKNKLDFVDEIKLRDITFNGKEKKYTKYLKQSFYFDDKKATLYIMVDNYDKYAVVDAIKLKD